MMIDQTIARIRAYRALKGWSINKYALAAGMRESTLRSMDRADWSPTADTLRKLESVIPEDFTGESGPAASPAPCPEAPAA